MSTSIRHCPPTDSGCNVTVVVPATHSSPRWNVNQNRPFLSCCFSGGFCYRNKESTNTKEHRERKLEKDIKTGKESGVLNHTCSSSTGLRGGKTAIWGFPELQKETLSQKRTIFFLNQVLGQVPNYTCTKWDQEVELAESSCQEPEKAKTVSGSTVHRRSWSSS